MVTVRICRSPSTSIQPVPLPLFRPLLPPHASNFRDTLVNTGRVQHRPKVPISAIKNKLKNEIIGDARVTHTYVCIARVVVSVFYVPTDSTALRLWRRSVLLGQHERDRAGDSYRCAYRRRARRFKQLVETTLYICPPSPGT